MTLKEQLARSSLAFVGTVQSLGQSPEPGIAVDDRTALVEVEQALRAPEQVDLSPGSAVVVQLSPDLDPLEDGDRATFFANPLVYGNVLVVSEVDRDADAPRAGRVSARRAVEELEEDAVREHAESADAVVRGHVIGLRAAASDPRREHDPHWWVATLDVDLVARGDADEGELAVLYANSLDRRWRDWPKPKAGQSGMWILHTTEGDAEQWARFQLMHPEDLQPSVTIDDLLGEAPEEDADEGDDES
jgi:hypothetical protein